MQHQMKKILLILQENLDDEHIKKEVFVSQLSKRLQESDLIQKAYAALMHTLDNNNSPPDTDAEMTFMENQIVMMGMTMMLEKLNLY